METRGQESEAAPSPTAEQEDVVAGGATAAAASAKQPAAASPAAAADPFHIQAKLIEMGFDTEPVGPNPIVPSPFVSVLSLSPVTGAAVAACLCACMACACGGRPSPRLGTLSDKVGDNLTEIYLCHTCFCQLQP
jgi:hypothetical protein